MRHSNPPPQRYYADDFDRRNDEEGHDRDDANRYRRDQQTRQSGRWGGEEPSYGRPYGERPAEPVGGGRPNRRGTQYEQGGQYPGSRETGPFEGVRSRSADPGQSSYGGFRGEDPRWQRQQLRYGDESPYDEIEGPAYSRRNERYSGSRGQAGRADDGGYRGGYGEGRGGGYGSGYGGSYGGGGHGGDYGGYGADEGGDYASRGKSQRISPKGYVRSDQRVLEDLCERLSHSGLDVSDVSVDVTDGTVTLEGTVPSRHMKHAIEDCADDCLGVTDIQNRIRVSGRTDFGMNRME